MSRNDACCGCFTGLLLGLKGRSLRRSSRHYSRAKYNEHEYTIEFENLVEEEDFFTPPEHAVSKAERDLLETGRYNGLVDLNKKMNAMSDEQLHKEEEDLRLEDEAYYQAKREASKVARQAIQKQATAKKNFNMRTFDSFEFSKWLSQEKIDVTSPEVDMEDFDSFLEKVKAKSLTPHTFQVLEDDTTSADKSWETSLKDGWEATKIAGDALCGLQPVDMHPAGLYSANLHTVDLHPIHQHPAGSIHTVELHTANPTKPAFDITVTTTVPSAGNPSLNIINKEPLMKPPITGFDTHNVNSLPPPASTDMSAMISSTNPRLTPSLPALSEGDDNTIDAVTSLVLPDVQSAIVPTAVLVSTSTHTSVSAVPEASHSPVMISELETMTPFEDDLHLIDTVTVPLNNLSSTAMPISSLISTSVQSILPSEPTQPLITPIESPFVSELTNFTFDECQVTDSLTTSFKMVSPKKIQ